MKRVLVTGGAGFIGFHVTKRLLRDGYYVVSIDNMNNYYDVELKNRRLGELLSLGKSSFVFKKIDLNDRDELRNLFNNEKIDYAINLAAQAGVRYAKENPDSYIQSNIDGFYNVIKLASEYGVSKFIYASSSSVYGANVKIPFAEDDSIPTPMSLYAATKAANESIAASYFYTGNLQAIGLRFFNVYGPWGRPDMAYFKWTKALVDGEELELRDDGEMWRDMTYIDDVVESIVRIIASSKVNKKPLIFNIGNESPVKIVDVLSYISKLTDKSPIINSVPKGSEEPVKTWANTDLLRDYIDYAPNTDYKAGIKSFVDWYRIYFSN